MEKKLKIQIYQGMIQYLLESTHYTLEDIADLSNSSIKNIRSIHHDGLIPLAFISEIQLIKLFQMVIEVKINQNSWLRCCSQLDGGLDINVI